MNIAQQIKTMTYNCNKFCGNTAQIICSKCAIKEATEEQLLNELTRRKSNKTEQCQFNNCPYHKKEI